MRVGPPPSADAAPDLVRSNLTSDWSKLDHNFWVVAQLYGVGSAIDARPAVGLDCFGTGGPFSGLAVAGAMSRVSEMLSPEAFQHFPRFKNSFPRLADLSICALDASAQPGNIHEAVV